MVFLGEGANLVRKARFLRSRHTVTPDSAWWPVFLFGSIANVSDCVVIFSERYWWASPGMDLAEAEDAPDWSQHTSAMFAFERLRFGQMEACLGSGSEKCPNLKATFFCGTTHKSVVPQAGKAFGQHVEEPAADELVWVQSHHGTLPGGAGCPSQKELAFLDQISSPAASGLRGA